MLEIHCSGTPYEIGFQHGQSSNELVHGTVQYYEDYFNRSCKIGWTAAEMAAAEFLPFLEKEVPHLVEEMRGIAEGAGVSFETVLALNARSEIAMGMMNDGCTSLSWKSDGFSIAAQNWDWENPQKARLVVLHIKPAKDGDTQRPKVSLVTEAGLLSKSGLNSHGVAVLINAIKAKGVNYRALPIHIAMRVVLDSESRLIAVARLHSLTLGTSGHLLIADETGGTSLEFSHKDIMQLEMVDGKIAHTNHFLVKHDPSVVESSLFPDSLTRQARITELLEQGRQQVKGGMAPIKCVETILEDEDNFPTGINRKSSPIKRSETLYSFVSDLKNKTARLRLGRPNECEGIWVFNPAQL